MKNNNWSVSDTTTHQDHVIAHVVDASILGYFIFDEAAYLLLDIGFVWTVFLNVEMGLLPHPVAINELQIDEEKRSAIKADIDLLLSGIYSAEQLTFLRPPPAVNKSCEIKAVALFANGDDRRLLLECEEATLAIETSLSTGEINFHEF